ncbi:hypothetical protein MNBD_GAMMA19-1258, partial [hydrothermal vent metagenome]
MPIDEVIKKAPLHMLEKQVHFPTKPGDPDHICYYELHKVQLFTEATMKTTTMGV